MRRAEESRQQREETPDRRAAPPGVDDVDVRFPAAAAAPLPGRGWGAVRRRASGGGPKDAHVLPKFPNSRRRCFSADVRSGTTGTAMSLAREREELDAWIRAWRFKLHALRTRYLHDVRLLTSVALTGGPESYLRWSVPRLRMRTPLDLTKMVFNDCYAGSDRGIAHFVNVAPDGRVSLEWVLREDGSLRGDPDRPVFALSGERVTFSVRMRDEWMRHARGPPRIPRGGRAARERQPAPARGAPPASPVRRRQRGVYPDDPRRLAGGRLGGGGGPRRAPSDRWTSDRWTTVRERPAWPRTREDVGSPRTLRFAQEGVDGAVLAHMDDAMLRELGVGDVAHRARILAAARTAEHGVIAAHESSRIGATERGPTAPPKARGPRTRGSHAAVRQALRGPPHNRRRTRWFRRA